MILDKELYIERGYFLGSIIALKNSISRIISPKTKEKVNLILERNRNSDFGYRGVPRLKTMENSDTLICTSCEVCEKICPSKCITIKSTGEGVAPKSFEIDLLKCVFCGFCVETCPEDALTYDRQKDLSGHAENNWKLNKEILKISNKVEPKGESIDSST
jgi:NADH-quinone oxidoreductase subunit I